MTSAAIARSQKEYNDMLNEMAKMINVQAIQPNTGQIFSTLNTAAVAPVATILSKDMTDFFNKKDDLLRDIFLEKLAGDMSKWKYASCNSTHQVIIKGPKGWSIIGNHAEGQLLHESKVIYRATGSDYQNLKPMAVSVVQIIQNAMDNEITRLKSSLVEDLDVVEEHDPKLPSFLGNTSIGSSIKSWTASAQPSILRSF